MQKNISDQISKLSINLPKIEGFFFIILVNK